METIFYVFDLLCILVNTDEIKQDNPISESGSHFSTLAALQQTLNSNRNIESTS